MKNKIYVISGKIASGKSTRLLQWLEDKENVCGIVQIRRNGKRFFYSLAEKNYFPMEIDSDNTDENVLTLGNFRFSEKSFATANEILRKCLKSEKGIAVIDEFGKLELDKNGFYETIGEAINSIRTERGKFKLVIVVRDYLLRDFLSAYKLNENEITLFASSRRTFPPIDLT